jgi:RNA polymerase sigma factor (sigma-70 family)
MNRDPRQVLTELLVLAAQRGEESAFTELYRLWANDLRRMALVRVERPDAADEVSNEVWVAIARGLGRLNDPACFPRWAFRIVARRSADWIRQRSRARQRDLAESAELINPAPSSSPAAEETDEILELRAMIARLPAEQRDLLHLYYSLDRSISEIAETLGIPPGTVKSRLYSVRENLKQMLERKVS